MPEITIDLSNLALEFDIIAYSLKAGGLPDGASPELFAGNKARWLAEKLQRMGTTCSMPLLLSHLENEGRAAEVDEFKALITRLTSQVVNENSIPIAVTKIKELAKGRKLATALSRPYGVAEKLRDGKVNEALRVLEEFMFSEHQMKGVIAEASFIADEKNILADLDVAIAQEEFPGVQTYIQPLDEVIFGLVPGEYGLIAGGTGEGKSITLTDIGMRNWEWGGKNVIGFTIEMKMRQQQYRQLAWALNIDINRFRSGDITPDERKAIGKFFEYRRAKENIFYWVDIPENVNASEIERKLIQAERKMHREFDLVLIDYLGIMSPIGNFSSRTGWDAQGEISLNLHNMARHVEKGLWVPVQKKENLSQKEKAEGGMGSIGLSYLIGQPADIVAVYTEKTLQGYMDVNIAKGRDVPKSRLTLRPDLRYAKIHRMEHDPLVRPNA